jgi:signal transduction histidine kinase
MLYQIINNIVSNSIKYNREKGKITISKNELENEVILKIADTGLGIKDENKDRIFKEYERVSGTKRKGTGLGLPLVKKLIELNDGKIWFESELDKGTTFYLMFKKSTSKNELKKID